MRVSVYYKDTYFVLLNVEKIGVLKHRDNPKGTYRKYIYFVDKEFGLLEYPLVDIKELHVYEK